MAKRMKSKIQPAVMKLNFLINGVGNENIPSGRFQTRFIDLSQVASLVNRRFYRQGLNWAVSSFQLQTPKDCSIVIQKLPNTWVMSNAWEKGMRAWMKQQREALAENPSAKPKFLDFKIHMDKHHRLDGFPANLLPRTIEYESSTQTSTVHTAVTGEWEPSKIYTPAFNGVPSSVNGFDIQAVGANNFSAATVSLIEGYAASRALPNTVDPNVPSDITDTDDNTPENWITAMFNEGTGQDTQILDDLITENNQAPYPYEGDGTATDTHYPGGANQLPGLEIHAIDSVTTTTIGGRTMLPGGNFPCGLIAVTINNDSDTPIGVGFEITLVPGTHRGYLCEPMTDM